MIILIAFYSFNISFSQNSNLGDTLGAFNAGILTPTPDRGLAGVEFAEGYFWITGFDPDDSYQHKLYKISADGQTLVDYYEYGPEVAAWKDLAYDGEFLYVADIELIRQINMETGEETGVTIEGQEYYQSGLAYDQATDHFWVSGDGNIIYEIDRLGNVINSVAFGPDLLAAGLAWDAFSEGGPYLWIWSMKYTSDDVRPKAFQMNPATGLLTGNTFEGVLMHPQAPYAADYSLGATITDELYEGKVALVGLHGSSYEQNNDQLDWVVSYDLDPEGTGIPGPVIEVNPTSIINDLLYGDTLDIPVFISNLSDSYPLDWYATLEYPGSDTMAIIGDSLFAFNVSAITPDSNNRMKTMTYADGRIFVSTNVGFNNRFLLYEIANDGSTLLDLDTLYSISSGWRTMTSDGQLIYAVEQYVIYAYDPNGDTIVDWFPRPNFSPDGIAYDPQMEHFYLGNGVGAIMQIDKNGDELNFYVVPYEIEGLSWDNRSPGGPYLWAYYSDEETPGVIRAIRLDPETGGTTGVAFEGLNLSGDPEQPDIPMDIMITPDWQQNKLVMIALHESNVELDDGLDKVIIYDLGITPSPGWIELLPGSFGTIDPEEEDIFNVRLRAIMDDTLMTAQVIINSNDVINPEVVIPVNFRMMPNIVEVSEWKQEEALEIFPNPFDRFLEVKTFPSIEGARLTLSDLSGKIVHEQQIPEGQKYFQLHTSNLPSGMYLLSIRGKHHMYTEKLIKK